MFARVEDSSRASEPIGLAGACCVCVCAGSILYLGGAVMCSPLSLSKSEHRGGGGVNKRDKTAPRSQIPEDPHKKRNGPLIPLCLCLRLCAGDKKKVYIARGAIATHTHTQFLQFILYNAKKKKKRFFIRNC